MLANDAWGEIMGVHGIDNGTSEATAKVLFEGLTSRDKRNAIKRGICGKVFEELIAFSPIFIRHFANRNYHMDRETHTGMLMHFVPLQSKFIKNKSTAKICADGRSPSNVSLSFLCIFFFQRTLG